MIRYLVIGLVQGVTEFLPVSSSGHLVLAQRLLGLASPGVFLEAMLHVGTLGAVLVVFWSDLRSLVQSLRGRGEVEQRKEVGLLLIGTVPAVVVGLLLRSTIEASFSSLWAIGLGLLVTAAALAWGVRARSTADRQVLGVRDAMVVGTAQALALFPGVSRSGMTISAGLRRGLSGSTAARFSFLLAIPALAGAGGLTLLDALRHPHEVEWVGLLIGSTAAFASGWAALRLLLRLLRRGRFWVFAVYCALVGTATILWAALG